MKEKPFLVVGCAIFLTLFAFYLRGISPTTATGDSGELTTAAWSLGIAHPPGYPAYVLAAKAVTLLIPFGNLAFRVACASALFAACACALIGLLLWGLTGDPLSGFIGSFLLGFSEPLFSQAVISEVYTLNALFAALLLWMLSQEAPSAQNLGLIFGLGFGNHQTLTFLLPSALLGIRKKFAAHLRGLILFGFVGALLYALLPIRSLKNPPADWDNPETVSGILHVVSRGGYGGLLHLTEEKPLKFSLNEILKQILFLGEKTQKFLTPIGTLLVLTGCLWLYRERKPFFWRLLLFYILSGPVFLILAGKPVWDPSQAEMLEDLLQPFLILPMMAACVAAGTGLSALPLRFKRYHGYVYFSIILFIFFIKEGGMSLRENFFSWDETRAHFRSLPADGLLIAERMDETVFLLAYAHAVERMRRDVHLVDGNASLLPNIYGEKYLSLRGEDRWKHRFPIESDLIASHAGHSFYATLDWKRRHPQPLRPHGTLYRVLGSERILEGISTKEFFVTRDSPNWPYRDRILAYSREDILSRAAMPDRPASIKHIRKARSYLKPSKAIFLQQAYGFFQRGDLEEAAQIYKDALTYFPQASDFWTNLGVIREKQDRFTESEECHKNALEIDPGDTQSRLNLAILYWRMSRWQEAEKELETALSLEPANSQAHSLLLKLRQMKRP